jgi:hypothetical protein
MNTMPSKSDEPDLAERELTGQDYDAIARALGSKRGLGWVHAMGLARRVLELQGEVARLRGMLDDDDGEGVRGRGPAG